MAYAEMQLCDLCYTPLEGRYPGKPKMFANKKEGLVITVGYSRGGWGSRRNLIDFSGEVCSDCYVAAMDAADHMNDTLIRLRSGVKEINNAAAE